ncbi:MAG: hypothetical protein IIW96_08040 [Oscillibacter sp.]|mgnify:CR=1 FL=1|jgi:hypothetical protein|nr:hypothetical protein [Oscillibacter sp.]
MASAAKDLRYRREYSVDGSLARDLDWEIRERQLRHAGETPRRIREEAQPQRRTAEKTQVHVELRQRQEVSYAAIAGVALVLGLAVMVLMSYIQLTVLSGQTVALKNELSQLQTQNVSLTTQYERMFDLATVKAAAEEAGMTKPSNSQICYVDLSGGDTAVVYQQSEPNAMGKALASLHHGFYAVMEYFD